MIYNAMLGALVGDAAGATLEFIGREITEEMALDAMKMPGGGPIRVGPGQITDDGELTLALWQALTNSRLNNYDTLYKSMIREYAKWYESAPFDIGRTCSFAFEAAYEIVTDAKDNTNNILTNNHISHINDIVNRFNETSEANGALMRSTAIASYVINYESDIINDMIRISDMDCSLSHPSQVCKEVNKIYLFSICNLLMGKSPQETLKLTEEFISNPESNISSYKVKQWFFEESLDISELNCKKMIGHVRWGFVMAIYFLRNPHITFEDAIKITLMKGGDTDTNAAIVGGMVGSYHNIPDYMLKPVLEFDCTKGNNYGRNGHNRPETYGVKYILK